MEEPQVTIRRARPGDARMLAAWRAMPELRIHQPLAQVPPGELARRLRSRERASLAEARGHELMWIIEVDGDAAGWVMLTIRDWEHRTARIGYSLAPWAQGKGIARAGVAQVLDLAFGPGRMERVDCDVMVDNERSRRLVEALGFQREGTLRSMARMPSGRRDFHLYGILAEEWRERSPRRAGAVKEQEPRL